MGSIRLFALGFFQNNDPVDLDPVDLDPVDLDPELPIHLTGHPSKDHSAGPMVGRKEPFRIEYPLLGRHWDSLPFRLHAQLYHHRPAAFGRTGRSARVLASGRHKTSLDGSLAFWHHSRSTLQTFPFQGVRPVRGTRLVMNPPRAQSPLHHERGWHGDDPSFLGVADDDGTPGRDDRGL